MATGMDKAHQLIQKNLEKQEKFLDLGNLGLMELPEELWELEHLEGLNLGDEYLKDGEYQSSVNKGSFNRIEEISSSIKRLPNLRFLGCEENRLASWDFLQLIPELEGLSAGYTQLKDISFLKLNAKIHTLRLRSNQIQDYSFLSSLTQLSTLYLRSNQIPTFPLFLLTNEVLADLKLFDNPIHDLPKELLGNSEYHNCLPDARAWFADLEKGPIENFELKLILIGNGRVGKSSIVDGLLGEEFDPQKRSTHAIQVEEWRPKGRRNPLKVNIWDFGGQDIYHGTHRLFLQSRALYLVVWDDENENDEKVELDSENGMEVFQNHRLRYWLDYVQALSKDSPVIVVQNKTDLHGELPVSERIGSDHHYNIQFTRAVSAKQGGVSFSYLKDTILKVLTSMREYGQQMPQSWYQVRERLSGLVQHQESLSYDEYMNICKELGITKTAPSLLNFLHHTGVVYHQQGLFDNRIILNQRWAIKAIYSLLNWQEDRFRLIKTGSGWFDNSILEEVWKDEYKSNERKVILSYMVSCELCFKINDNEDHPLFVIPQLLEERAEPSIEDTWEDRYDQSLRLVYRIPFLHDALIHRFITKVGRLAEPRGLWRKGISMKYNLTYARIEAVDAHELSIWVNGPQQDDLLIRIRNTFQELFRDYDEVERLIGAQGSPLVRLEEAEKYRSKEEVAAVDGSFVKIESLRPFFKQNEEAKIDELVPKAPAQRAARLYLSWSGVEQDQGFREDMIKHLSVLQRKGKVEIWGTGYVQPGQERKSAMQEAWGKADLYVLLLSADYVNSDDCYGEMQALLKQAKGQENIFIPICCRPCDFEALPITKHQMLPRNRKTIIEQPIPDAAWQEVVKEIRTVIEGLGW